MLVVANGHSLKSYRQSPEHSVVPTKARNPDLFLLSLGIEFCPPRGPAPARSHILQGPVLYEGHVWRTLQGNDNLWYGQRLQAFRLAIKVVEIAIKSQGAGY
jgi:hypothetical protein